MNTTRNDHGSTPRLGSLKKFRTRAVLAGGVGLAVIGLGAGTANASPSFSLSCQPFVTAGSSGTVTVNNYPGGSLSVQVYDASYPGPAADLNSLDRSTGYVNGTNTIVDVTWPKAPLGPHLISAFLGDRPEGGPDHVACLVTVI